MGGTIPEQQKIEIGEGKKANARWSIAGLTKASRKHTWLLSYTGVFFKSYANPPCLGMFH